MLTCDSLEITPIYSIYQTAIQYDSKEILDELSMCHVIAVFQDYIDHDPSLALITDTKFGVILLQNVASPDCDPDLEFLVPESGLELCYFLLGEIVYDIYYGLMLPVLSTELPTDNTMNLFHICSAEHEAMILQRIEPYLSCFPLTREALADSIFNYPNRLYA